MDCVNYKIKILSCYTHKSTADLPWLFFVSSGVVKKKYWLRNSVAQGMGRHALCPPPELTVMVFFLKFCPLS